MGQQCRTLPNKRVLKPQLGTPADSKGQQSSSDCRAGHRAPRRVNHGTAPPTSRGSDLPGAQLRVPALRGSGSHWGRSGGR